MQVSLPLELEELIKVNVANGVYTDENEVICAALQLLKEYTEYLKEEIRRGVDEADKKVFSSKTIEDLKAEGRYRLNNQKH